MFSEYQTWLLNRVLNSDFRGARAFAINVKSQGFMSQRQEEALKNMNNSLKPWSSRTNKTSRHDGWDHDDLAEGWAGY
jgi:hypothetical protein